MNISIRTLTCVAALAAIIPVFAQEESASEDSEVKAEDPAVDEKAEKHISEIDDKLFTVLPFCKRLEGRAEVRLPNASDWARVEEGRFFPLGSFFRTTSEQSRLEIAFGRESVVSIVGIASFGTRQQGLDVKSRTIMLDSGTVEVRLPLNFPEGMFCVTNSGFCIDNPAGVSRYTYRRAGDGSVALVRCVSGVLTVRGRHFTIPAMHAANEVEIRTSQDVLFTGLFGKSGDFICKLDNGMVQEVDLDTTETTVVRKFLDWKLSPSTAIRIFRKVPEVGKNLAVGIMTFDSNGELKNRCSFTEDRYEINTGDQGPSSVAERERVAKALKEAADASETTVEDAHTAEKTADIE